MKKADIKTVDCLILTHPHDDHIGGAARILTEFSVKECILTNATSDSSLFQTLIETLSENTVTVREGYRRAPMQYGDLGVEILWPTMYPEHHSENDRSLVLRVTYGENSILLPGDVSSTVETALLASFDAQNLRSQILKVGHHGAKSSTSEQFLVAVAPRYAVISCGQGNSYSYPHVSLMTRLMAAEATVFRTDTDGTIVFRGNGIDFEPMN